MTTEFLLENVFRQIGEFRENPCLNLLFFKYLQIKIINKTKGPILGMECFVTLHSHEVCRQVLLVWMQQLHEAVKVPNTLYVFILKSSDTWHFFLLLQDRSEALWSWLSGWRSALVFPGQRGSPICCRLRFPLPASRGPPSLFQKLLKYLAR